MAKYIVAHVNQFDNELTQTLIEADSELEAALSYLGLKQDCVFDPSEQERFTDLGDLVEMCYDMDMNISVFKIE